MSESPDADVIINATNSYIGKYSDILDTSGYELIQIGICTYFFLLSFGLCNHLCRIRNRRECNNNLRNLGSS